MGEVAESYGVASGIRHLLFSQTPAQGLTAQAGVTQEKKELACGWHWASAHTPVHTAVHTHGLLLLYGLQAMTDCVWELKTVTYSDPWVGSQNLLLS